MKRLQELIQDHDMTQEDLAAIIGVHRKQIGRWINGQAEMGIDKLKKICEYYKVSADYILGLPDDLSWPRKENLK